MATLIARSRQHVLDLLKVQANVFMPTSGETNDLVDDMLRREFKHLWSKVPPVFRGAFTVETDNTVEVSSELGQVLGVSSRRHLLLPEVEWGETAEGFFVYSLRDAAPGDTLLCWYTTVPEISYHDESTPTTTIDSSCVLGPDWLEEVAEYGAMLRVLVRTSRDAASGGSDRDSVMYRVFETSYNAMTSELVAARERFLARMDGRIGARVNLGAHVFRESELSGVENLSRLESRETGFRTGGE